VGLIYLDASILMPLLVADAHTTRAVAWYSGGNATLIVSDLADLEVSAVVSRGLRTGRLTQDAAENALLDFDVIRANCDRLSHGAADFLLAQRLARPLDQVGRRRRPASRERQERRRDARYF
jgi:hypothetical protein